MKTQSNKSSLITPSFLSAVCLLFLSMVLTASPVEFPATPAGIRAAEILSLLNGTFSRSAEDYIQNDYAPTFRDAFPLAQHQQIFSTTGEMFGKMTLFKIISATETEIRFNLQSESRSAGLNITLRVESDPPHRIAVMGIRPGQPPVERKSEMETNPVSPGKKSLPSVEKNTGLKDVEPEDLDRMISAKTEAGEFSGVVLVAREGEPLFHKAYGLASKRYNVPNRTDTRFNLGSINKSFTAVAVLQLMEQGKLELDDPIGKYLDVFPGDIAEKVTIRHLLNMRSGWGDFWGHPSFQQGITRLRKVSQYLDFIKDIPLDFEPGSNFQHSNTGYEVAGAIIEKISGMDYFEYIRKHIYKPAGMADSDSFDRDGPAENLAVGYTNINPADPEGTGYLWENTYMLSPKGTPAGGGYSTAADMLKYKRALTGNRLLSPEMTRFYFSGFNGRSEESPEPRRRYAAAGGAPGVNAFFVIDFDSGLTFIVLCNYDHPVGINLTREILKIYGLDDG